MNEFFEIVEYPQENSFVYLVIKDSDILGIFDSFAAADKFIQEYTEEKMKIMLN